MHITALAIVVPMIAAAALVVGFVVLQTVRGGQAEDEVIEERPTEEAPGKPAYSEAV